MDAHRAAIYHSMADAYDPVFERWFKPRLKRALDLLNPQPGQRLIDIGVGTGWSLGIYPKGLKVVGMDLAANMLEKARQRALYYKWNPLLTRMDAQRLGFADGCFDFGVVAYVVSVVPNPRALINEVARVVKPGGTIAVLNHFRADTWPMCMFEDMVAPLCVKLGWKSDLRLEEVFDGMEAVKVVRVARFSTPDLWRIVLCRSNGCCRAVS